MAVSPAPGPRTPVRSVSLLPVGHLVLHGGPCLVGVFVEELAPGGKIGAEPFQSVFAQVGALLVVRFVGVFPLTGGGEGGEAGGVVAVAGFRSSASLASAVKASP